MDIALSADTSRFEVRHPVEQLFRCSPLPDRCSLFSSGSRSFDRNVLAVGVGSLTRPSNKPFLEEGSSIAWRSGSWYQIVELRAAQKISTAWVAAAAMIDRCAGVLITSSSSRFTIEPASNRTAGIRVLLSTMSWS